MTVSLKSLHKTFPDGTEAVRGIDLDGSVANLT